MSSKDAVKTVMTEAEKQLTEYFLQMRKKFNLPLEPQGTQFQKKVWMALLTIPYGTTITYKELAQKIGSPKAYRAVGSACGKNPLPIIIPCHRVIASHGKLGGYSAGAKAKLFLLTLEQS